MRPVNLFTYLYGKKTLNNIMFKKFKSVDCQVPLKHTREKEENDLIQFCQNLFSFLTNDNLYIMDNYYLNYQIKQISKEFDLLRFGENEIINIEIKHKEVDSIKKQLIQNQYYLNSIYSNVLSYTYCVCENKLFKLIDNKLENVDFKDLILVLSNQKSKSIYNIDLLFNPTQYLISPFNSPQKFIDNCFF